MKERHHSLQNRIGVAKLLSQMLIYLGLAGFALGAIQLLPAVRRRAAQRGFSPGKTIPFTICLTGFIVWVVGVVTA